MPGTEEGPGLRPAEERAYQSWKSQERVAPIPSSPKLAEKMEYRLVNNNSGVSEERHYTWMFGSGPTIELIEAY